jgi:SPP1 family predicted phage head-tail adaptor
LKIGPLRKFVSLQSVSRTQDGFGEDVDSFAQYDQVWCSISPMRGQEQISADQQSGRGIFSIKTRYNSSIVVTDRVVYVDPGRGTRTFEINFIRDIDERNHWMELVCTEVKDS